MSWTKVEAFMGQIHQGCLSCPPVAAVAPMNMLIAVGFGRAQVTKDGKVIYDEMDVKDDKFKTLGYFEKMAAKDPDHDWRVILDAPLRSREYQRHDTAKWVLIKSGEGFA